MAARKRTPRVRPIATLRSVRSPKLGSGRRFRVLFAAQVGRVWQLRTDHMATGATVAAVLAPLLKNRKLTGASITVEESRS